MDFQTTFNLILGSMIAVLGWLARTLWDAVQDLKEDFATLRENIASERVHKDDLRSLTDAIFRKLDRIEDKLDGKVDK